MNKHFIENIVSGIDGMVYISYCIDKLLWFRFMNRKRNCVLINSNPKFQRLKWKFYYCEMMVMSSAAILNGIFKWMFDWHQN